MKILILVIIGFLYLMNSIFGFGFFLPVIAAYNSTMLSIFSIFIFDMVLVSNYFLIQYFSK